MSLFKNMPIFEIILLIFQHNFGVFAAKFVKVFYQTDFLITMRLPFIINIFHSECKISKHGTNSAKS